MPAKRLPADAFEYYFGLGAGRSYRSVADHFEVSKSTVANLAAKEDWPRLVAEREQKAKSQAEVQAVESLEEMCTRHIKVLKLVQRKALEALRTMPITNAMDAVRALDMAVKQERLVRGEPTDRTAVGIEQVIKEEYERWLTTTE
ncbi:MAG: hypothetical protein H6807_15180 [Planctomycetes bacterium]|nr:hypothetical protein [Planctomycetota bacterium]